MLKKTLSIILVLVIAVTAVPLVGLTEVFAADWQNVLTYTSSGTAITECNILESGSLEIPVTSVTLNNATESIAIDATKQLIATVSPSDATNKAVTWSSSNTDVATVSNSGLATAKAVGNATITCKTKDGGKTATCAVTVIPNTPTVVEATSISYNSFQISWAAVSGATGYEVWMATSRTGTYSKLTTTTKTTYTKTNLTESKIYYFKVRAYKTVDETNYYSGYSAIVSATAVPDTPTAVEATSISYNSIKISWAAVLGATGYVVYFSTSQAGTYTMLGTTDSETLMYTHKLLTTGTTYYYKVRAYWTVGGTKYYSSYSAVVSAKAVCATPTDVKATPALSNSIKISWVAVSGATGYEVYRATSQDGTYSSCGSTAGASYTDTDLVIGTTYYYMVRAYRTVGETTVFGYFSTVVSAMAVPDALVGPDAPTSVAAASASYNSIKISWATVSGATGYEVFRATSKDGAYSSCGATTEASFTDTSCATGTTYYYKVKTHKVINGENIYSVDSAVVSAKTVLDAPKSVAAASASYNSIKVRWAAVSGATGYEVFRAVSQDGTYSSCGSTTATSFTDTPCATGTTYYYKVKAQRLVNGENIYSADSAVVSAMAIPSIPAFVTASPSYNSIKISWETVTGATAYEVWRAVSKEGPYTCLVSTEEVSYTDSNVTAGTTYHYKIGRGRPAPRL